MISQETKRALEARYWPGLDDAVFAPFQEHLRRNLHAEALALDHGSGPGSWVLQEERDNIGALIGVDVYTPDTSGLDAFVRYDGARLPFADASLDVVVSYLVMEHMEDPLAAYREIGRVLKPGGAFLFKTPAVNTPLFLLAKVLPTSLHKRLKSKIGTDEDDVFPTYYRANTVSRLESDLRAAGFERDLLYTVDQTYAYMPQNRLTYALGLLYSRSLQARWLSWLRNQIIGVYRRSEVTA